MCSNAININLQYKNNIRMRVQYSVQFRNDIGFNLTVALDI